MITPEDNTCIYKFLLHLTTKQLTLNKEHLQQPPKQTVKREAKSWLESQSADLWKKDFLYRAVRVWELADMDITRKKRPKSYFCQKVQIVALLW